MITTRGELNFYLKEDKKALGISNNKSRFLNELLIPNRIFRFQKILRKTEYYYHQSQRNFWYKPQYILYKYLHRKHSLKLGFSIPINVFGPGLSIAHYGTIVVNPATKVGANCRLHVCVNIGATNGSKKAPVIGDNVYIAPGCKIFGDIEISDNTTISANSVVNKSFTTPNALLGGIPAKVLKTYNDKPFSWKPKHN